MNFFDFGEVITMDTEFVIFGIPWDYFTSLKNTNSASAPEKIREVSQHLALTTEQGIKIPELRVIDLGNIDIKKEKIPENLKKIQNFIENIYNQKQDLVLIMIGGDHFCSYPVIKACGNRFKEEKSFGVIIFDAHLDFYQEFDNNIYSHAAVSHRIYDLEFINPLNFLIVGTRDIDIPELELAKQEKITYFNAYESIDGLNDYINRIILFFQKSNIKNLYLSIDIDVLDPSIAPATGYAIPGGFLYRDLWSILKKISQNFNIIGFDVVEVSPNLDLPNNITCNLAAKLITELISFISNR